MHPLPLSDVHTIEKLSEAANEDVLWFCLAADL